MGILCLALALKEVLIQDQKSQLRSLILQKREEMSAEKHSSLGEKLVFRAKNFLEPLEFSTIFFYFPFKKEADLLPLAKEMRGRGKKLALPCVEKGGAMSFYEWDGKAPLVKNRFGIPEPDKNSSAQVTPDKKSVFFIPSVALDKKGTRLGMGAGFYDRYLREHKEVLKVGVVFNEFLLEKIPEEAHDIKMDVILTEQEIIFL